MLIHIDPQSSEPVYEQIVFHVKSSVAQGQLSAGDKLPSVRSLSKELSLNPNTVNRAYDALERDQVIVRRQGAGCFVTGAASTLNGRERRRRLGDAAGRLVTEAYHLGFDAEQVRDAVGKALGKIAFENLED